MLYMRNSNYSIFIINSVNNSVIINSQPVFMISSLKFFRLSWSRIYSKLINFSNYFFAHFRNNFTIIF